MRRREAITLIAAALSRGRFPLPLGQPTRLPVVGLVFTPGSRERMPEPNCEGARARLCPWIRDLGWIDGRNVMIERRTAEADPQRLIGLFADLQTLGAKVNVLAGARWIQDAAVRAAPGVPIVTLFHEDPVAAGLIASLARPGGSLTGITSTTGPEIDDKRLQLVMEMLSGVTRVAFLGTKNQLERFQAGASSPPPPSFPSPSISSSNTRRPSRISSTSSPAPLSSGPARSITSTPSASWHLQPRISFRRYMPFARPSRTVA